jgi:hypothetical protein
MDRHDPPLKPTPAANRFPLVEGSLADLQKPSPMQYSCDDARLDRYCNPTEPVLSPQAITQQLSDEGSVPLRRVVALVSHNKLAQSG